MLPSFCKDVATVKRAQLVDRRGTKVLDWSNPETFELSGCSVQASTTARDFNGRSIQVTEEWTLYAPPGSDLQAGDRIEWENATFEINGAPMPWKSPTGRVSHVKAKLTEWRG